MLPLFFHKLLNKSFPLTVPWASQVPQAVRNPLAIHLGSIPGKIPWRRAWQPTPVFLPGESPWTEKPSGLQSIGLQKVRHNWPTKHTHTVPYLHLPLSPIISKSFLYHNSMELTSFVSLKNILFNRTSNSSSSILLVWFSATFLTVGHFFLLKFSVLWFMILFSWFTLIVLELLLIYLS